MTRLIDADALKKAFDFDDDVELQCAVVHYGIDNAPTVDPVKHGHWEKERIGADKIDRCSVCGGSYLPCIKSYKFCPQCGARMDAEEWEEPEINPCRGCEDYDGNGGCISNGGCGR